MYAPNRSNGQSHVIITITVGALTTLVCMEIITKRSTLIAVAIVMPVITIIFIVLTIGEDLGAGLSCTKSDASVA